MGGQAGTLTVLRRSNCANASLVGRSTGAAASGDASFWTTWRKRDEVYEVITSYVSELVTREGAGVRVSVCMRVDASI